MPHMIVKLWPGKSEQQKTRMAAAITKDVMENLHYGDESISVGFEEVKSQDWLEKVLQTRHQGQMEQALQKAGIR